MREERKKLIDDIFGWVQKLFGFVILGYLIYHHVNVRPISYPIIMIPLVLIGVDIKKLITR